MHRPPTLATVAEATPATNGVSSCTVLRPARASRDGSKLTSLNPARDAVYVGAESKRTLMAGAVALASTGYIAAIDEKAWAGPRRLGRASRVPTA